MPGPASILHLESCELGLEQHSQGSDPASAKVYLDLVLFSPLRKEEYPKTERSPAIGESYKGFQRQVCRQ